MSSFGDKYRIDNNKEKGIISEPTGTIFGKKYRLDNRLPEQTPEQKMSELPVSWSPRVTNPLPVSYQTEPLPPVKKTPLPVSYSYGPVEPFKEKKETPIDYGGTLGQANTTGIILPQKTEKDKTLESFWRQKRVERATEEEKIKTEGKKEEYTPASTFIGKIGEAIENKGYTGSIGNMITNGFATTIEQLGMSMNSPIGNRIRNFGENLGAKIKYDFSISKEGQSLANVPSFKEGGIIDPRYYASTVSNALGYMGTIAASSIMATALSGGNPLAGKLAGFSIGAALEAANAYDDMIRKGINPEDAKNASRIYAIASSLIENSFGIKPMEVLGWFKKLSEKFVTSGAWRTFATQLMSEALEEPEQQFVQNFITKEFKKDQKLTEGLIESFYGGLIGSIPMVGGSMIGSKIIRREQKQETPQQPIPQQPIPQPRPTLTLPKEVVITPQKPVITEKPTTPVIKEDYSKLGPGHEKFYTSVDSLVNDGTFHKEDAVIIKEVFKDTKDEFLNKIDLQSSARLKRAGNAHYFDRLINIIRGAANRSLNEKDWLSESEVEPTAILLHEYGHIGWYSLLSHSEKSIITDVYREMGKKKINEMFKKEGLVETPQKTTAGYFGKNEKEFFVQSFAEYVFANKVPSEKMRPLLERLLIKFRDALKRLVNRGEIKSMDRLTPLFEKLLSGDIAKPLSDFHEGTIWSEKENIKKLITEQEEDLSEVEEYLKKSKGLSADDIMKKYPDINLKKEVVVTDIFGEKRVIPEGEALTPYELKGNKVLLQDGETYIVTKNKFDNIKGNSVKSEAKEFAPELKGIEESVKAENNSKWVGDEFMVDDELVANVIKNEDGTWSYQSDFSEGEETFKHRLDAVKAAETATIGDIYSNIGTKYSQYQLPGGKNYKEILIKAKGYADELTLDQIAKDNYDKDFRLLNVEQKGVVSDLHDKLNKAYNSAFKSSHWDEPNVISHLRLNERTYKGKKVTFMEELQSDWAREVREQGDIKPVDKLPEGVVFMQEGNTILARSKENVLLGEGNTFAQARENAIKFLNKDIKPNHPLLKNWQELSIKRALKEAVDNNSAYLAWTTGEQQASRYNLATYLENVNWEANSAGGKRIYLKAKEKGSSIETSINKNGIIEAAEGTSEHTWVGKKLDEVIGKGLADKIMASETGTLSGEGLKFGGEWANNLYDKQIKNIVEDLTGAKVEVIDMGLPIDKKTETLRLGIDAFKPLKNTDLKVGKEFNKGIRDSQYIITDILGDGKFKAVPKEATRKIIKDDYGSIAEGFTKKLQGTDLRYKTSLVEEFDISTKQSSGQQAIKITPEIKAIIKGEAPAIKKASGRPVIIPKPISKTKEEESKFTYNWEVKMPLEKQGDETINKTEIMRWTEEAFNIPIKGKATFRWKEASGAYYPKKWVARLSKWGELSPMVHEVAHHIDNTILPKGWKDLIPASVITELEKLDYEPDKARIKEGFAEYIRYRLTTEEASKMAPNFDKYFNSLLKDESELNKRLNKLKEKLNIWYTQGAENRVIQQVDWKGEHSIVPGIKNKAKEAARKFQIQFNDEFYALNKLVKEVGEISKKEFRPTTNPSLMAEFSKAKAGSIANWFVTENAIDEAGNIVGKSLAEILKPITKDIGGIRVIKNAKEKMQKFLAYAISKRAILLENRKIESGFDLDDAKFIVEKYKNEEWDKVIEELTKWSDHLLDWVIHAGGLSVKDAILLKKLNPMYLPFKRAFIDEVQAIKGGTGSIFNIGRMIKKIKGSGRPIYNPIEMMIAQATQLISKSQKLRIANNLVKLSNETGVGGWIQRVPAPLKVSKFNASQIKNYIEEITGVELDEEISDDILSIFGQDNKYTGKDNIVKHFRNGKTEFYEINKELYETLAGIDPMAKPELGLEIGHKFARAVRLGATGVKVSFNLIKNPLKDIWNYIIGSKNAKANPFDFFRGIYYLATAKPGTLAYRYKAMGGAMAGQIGLDRRSTSRAYDELLAHNLGKKGMALMIVRHPINTFRDVLSFGELIPRAVTVEDAYKKYTSPEWKQKHQDWTEEDAFMQAFLDAQDVTINFTKSGKSAKKINQFVAFFNVALRGPEKFYRNFKERPTQTLLKSFIYLTMPALLSWYRNKDEDWYKALEPQYRYNNLFYKVGKNVIRLPIPFELGALFMSVPQMLADAAFTNQPKEKTTEDLLGILKIAATQIPNPFEVSAIMPIWQVERNKNYLGTPIESKGMEYKVIEDRVNPGTGKLAKFLSKAINNIPGVSYSPIQVQYLMNSYSGGALKQFKATGGEVYNFPIISDLMLQDPGYPARQLNNFFNDYTELGKKVNSDKATLEEEYKYYDTLDMYQMYKLIQDDIVEAKANKDRSKWEKCYKEMTKELEYFGYK